MDGQLFTYDDGSTLAMFDDGSTFATNASDSGIGAVSGYTFATDAADAAKVAKQQPGTAGQPWWQNALTYGFTKGMDAWNSQQAVDTAIRARSAGVAGYAGANGLTYYPGVAGAFGQPVIGNMSLGTLLIFGGLAYLLLSK